MIATSFIKVANVMCTQIAFVSSFKRIGSAPREFYIICARKKSVDSCEN